MINFSQAKIKKGDIFPLSKICRPFCRKISHCYSPFDENDESTTDFNSDNYGKCKYCLHYRKLEETCGTENELHRYPRWLCVP